MAEVQNAELQESLSEKVLSLMEVSEQLKDYPLIVRIVQTEGEILDSGKLPEDKEILLERPKWLQFASIRILDIKDEAVLEENDEGLGEERKKYVGKKYLIPMGYSGTLKLINKTGQHDKYVTIEQIIQDLPRYIRIDQETIYSDPEQPQSVSTLAAGTKLKVEHVFTSEDVRYISCKSIDTSRTYTFREDLPINCTAVEDPYEHTLLNIQENVLLPKNAQFLNVSAENIVLKEDNEASTMLSLLGGPIRILNTSIRRNLFLAWTKSQEKCSQTVALFPHRSWNNQLVQLKTFSSVAKKQAYIKQHFGENFDSNIVMHGLYMMSQTQSEMVWLLAPKDKITEEDKEKDKEDGKEEKYGASVSDALPRKPAEMTKGFPKAMLATLTARTENIHLLQTLKDKAKRGIEKVQRQISKQTKTEEVHEPKTEEMKDKKVPTWSTHEQYRLPQAGETKGDKEVATVCRKQQGEAAVGSSNSYDHLGATDPYKERPLPELPKKCINVSDDDKLYDRVNDKEKMFRAMLEKYKRENPTTKPSEFFSDNTPIEKTNQTCKDFYSYTVDDLVNCFKMCNLNKLATECHENRLDGAFFRNFDLDELKTEPFCLSSLEFCKVRKIIKEGWRPKLD